MLSFHDLKLPTDWQILVGFDTGTFMSCVFAAFNPDPYQALILAEFPNYRYVGGEPELLDISNVAWAKSIVDAYNFLRPGTSKVYGYVDMNTQFRRELQRYGLYLKGNPRKLELRTEVSREYVHAHDPQRWYLAPWLTILPYEMEHATWPDESTVGGKYERYKQNDHTLDCMEHILSRRPRTKIITREHRESFLERYLREHRRPDREIRAGFGDRHLGRHT